MQHKKVSVDQVFEITETTIQSLINIDKQKKNLGGDLVELNPHAFTCTIFPINSPENRSHLTVSAINNSKLSEMFIPYNYAKIIPTPNKYDGILWYSGNNIEKIKRSFSGSIEEGIANYHSIYKILIELFWMNYKLIAQI